MKLYLRAISWPTIPKKIRGMFNLNDSRWGPGDAKPAEGAGGPGRPGSPPPGPTPPPSPPRLCTAEHAPGLAVEISPKLIEIRRRGVLTRLGRSIIAGGRCWLRWRRLWTPRPTRTLGGLVITAPPTRVIQVKHTPNFFRNGRPRYGAQIEFHRKIPVLSGPIVPK